MSEQANKKHTRGPWRFEVTGACGDFTNPHDIGDIVNDYARIAENVVDRDAALIAAAPELLEALEECEKALTQYIDASTAMNPVIKQSGYLHPVVKLRDRARAAIAKATGAQ